MNMEGAGVHLYVLHNEIKWCIQSLTFSHWGVGQELSPFYLNPKEIIFNESLLSRTAIELLLLAA